MLTGELRSKIDNIWETLWTGGISNPLTVIEQLTTLFFIRMLDEAETREEKKSQKTGKPMAKRIFQDDQQEMRWHLLVNKAPLKQFEIMEGQVFPFLRNLGDEGSALARHMKDVRLQIPSAELLYKITNKINDLEMRDKDTKGDVYEYMLGKIASSGVNGQFRTPRHIIGLMVAMSAPTPKDVITDPASGTCGFLVGASEYLEKHHEDILFDPELRDHYQNHMFHGFDSDSTMLRIGAMNMVQHGVTNPNVRYRDSLSKTAAEEGDHGKYSLILANPPFKGSLDEDGVAEDLLSGIKTKKTELLFLRLFLRQLRVGGRAAVIVPDGVMTNNNRAYQHLRKMLIEEHQLQGIVKMPSGVFKPYAGVSTAIVFFTKTGVGGTENVWFYNMEADGYSLDDKRTPLLPENKEGVFPKETLSQEEAEKNNLPDILERWRNRETSERENPRTARSFCVPKEEIVQSGSYDLSFNRYREIIQEEVHYDPPQEIIANLKKLDEEIRNGLIDLEKALAE